MRLYVGLLIGGAIGAMFMSLWSIDNNNNASADKTTLVRIPKKGPVAFPVISDQVNALLNAHAFIYRANTLVPYDEFADAYKRVWTPRVAASVMLATAGEMSMPGFGRMPMDTDSSIVYLVFPIETDLTAINKTLHTQVCTQFIRESGKTFEEWMDLMYE